MGDPLGSEKKYLKANRDQFMQEYPGKYLLIKGDQVFGAFETYEEGVKEGARTFGGRSFSGQIRLAAGRCRGTEHSRVVHRGSLQCRHLTSESRGAKGTARETSSLFLRRWPFKVLAQLFRWCYPLCPSM